MASTTSTVTAAQVALAPDHVGILNDAPIPTGSLEQANKLLQKNHDTWHMFFRDKAGHNHIAHSILTCLALGADPSELQRAYEDGIGIQRPIPDVDNAFVEQMSNDDKLFDAIGTITQYTSFLVFFQQEIDKHGYKDVINKYLFSRSKVAEKMLARMFEGAYHPIIHLGLGVEFAQPSIVAEALAQAAAHDDSDIGILFNNCEEQVGITYPPKTQKSLIQLVHETRNDDTIRNAPVWQDFGNKMKNGIVGRAGLEMAFIGSQFRILKPEDLERRTAEVLSTAAYFAGASQRPGRKRKIDFFYMHAVTSSIFFSVFIRQDWIKVEDRIRLVEWKARLDLAWYAVCGCAELHADAVENYHDDFSANMDWRDLYTFVNKEHDDGHVAKLIRALKNAQEASKPFEQGEFADNYPCKADTYLKIARMALDTTKDWPTDLKWVNFTGFDMGWKIRPDLA